MPSPLFHKDRVRENLGREIGWTISNKLRDPRIPAIVTVTQVALAQDMRNATVFVSMYGSDEEKSDALAALNHAIAFVQKTVAARVRMKTKETPAAILFETYDAENKDAVIHRNYLMK